jgi:hypothetical protein
LTKSRSLRWKMFHFATGLMYESSRRADVRLVFLIDRDAENDGGFHRHAEGATDGCPFQRHDRARTRNVH